MAKYICRVFQKFEMLLLVFTILTVVSCKDIIQDDLSDKDMVVIIPQDNFHSSQATVHFKWEELEDANAYTIQIVSPSFDSIIDYVLDSVVRNGEFFYSLNPGVYQWRLKGNNTGTSTGFTQGFNLSIDSSLDLSLSTVTLSAPAQNFVSSVNDLTFSWLAVSGANNYQLIVKSGSNWNSATTLHTFQTGSLVQQSVSSLVEGEYVWGVSAENNLPSSSSFTTRNFYIDTTSPPQVSLSSPLDKDTLQDSTAILFNWNRPADVGSYQSAITDHLEIYSDSLVTKIDSSSTSGSSLNYSFDFPGSYFWRIVSIDEAGNESIPSTARKVIIEP